MKKGDLFTSVILLAFTGLLLTSLNSCKTNKNIGLQLYSIHDSITRSGSFTGQT